MILEVFSNLNDSMILSWEGIQLGQLTPDDLRDIPYHTMSYSAIKAGGIRKRWTFGVMAFVFPSNFCA